MPSRSGVLYLKTPAKVAEKSTTLENRETSVKRVMGEIEKTAKTRGDGLKVAHLFREEQKDKWVSPTGFRVPTSATLLQNLKSKAEKDNFQKLLAEKVTKAEQKQDPAEGDLARAAKATCSSSTGLDPYQGGYRTL